MRLGSWDSLLTCSSALPEGLGTLKLSGLASPEEGPTGKKDARQKEMITYNLPAEQGWKR